MFETLVRGHPVQSDLSFVGIAQECECRTPCNKRETNYGFYAGQNSHWSDGDQIPETQRCIDSCGVVGQVKPCINTFATQSIRDAPKLGKVAQ